MVSLFHSVLVFLFKGIGYKIESLKASWTVVVDQLEYATRASHRAPKVLKDFTQDFELVRPKGTKFANYMVINILRAEFCDAAEKVE